MFLDKRTESKLSTTERDPPTTSSTEAPPPSPPIINLSNTPSVGAQIQEHVLKEIGKSTFKYLVGSLIVGAVAVIAFTKLTGRDHGVLLQTDATDNGPAAGSRPTMATAVNHDV
jgi:hypothetical protein